MLDLNHILLFIALVSPLVLLWRLARLHGERPTGWVAAALVVLGVCGASYLLAPRVAGFLAGAAWALLLLIPSLAERATARMLVEKRYRAARRIAVVRRLLHPWNDGRTFPQLLEAMERAQAGQLPAALDLLARTRTDNSRAARTATVYTYALTENWEGLVQWCRRDLRMTTEPEIRALYLRALGETGALEDLAWGFAAQSQRLQPRPNLTPQAAQELLCLLAFAGRTPAVLTLFAGALAKMPRPHQEFWIATSELAEGRREMAIARLTKLRGHAGDAILEKAVAGRLAHASTYSVAIVAPATGKLITRLATETSNATSSFLTRPAGTPVAVWSFIVLNLLMFVAELSLGGATNVRTLHQLGALEPQIVLAGHQYWRLLTALFLHYGVLHISFNLYALYLLGPGLEKIIGSARFALGYLLSGLGSSAGVVLLTALGLTHAGQIVGASGCVMGVIGISAGLLLRHRQTPLAGRRLREILMIVAFQTVFDLSTPQVSLSAHLSGFVTGVLIGMLFAARRAS